MGTTASRTTAFRRAAASYNPVGCPSKPPPSFPDKVRLVGQCLIPGAPEGAVAPGEELLAGNDVMIGDAHRPGLLAVVVAAEEVVLVVPGKNRVSLRMVLVPANVDAFCEIRARELGVRNRPGCELVQEPY